MNKQNAFSQTTLNSQEYSNKDWPRDFDFRAEVAEQQEIIEQKEAIGQSFSQPLTCSEYDF